MARTPFRWTLHVALSGALLAGVGCGEGDTESQSSRTNNGNQPTGDTVPPTISITQPQSFATLEPMALTVIGVAADNEGLDRVDIRVDDGEFELASGLDNWSFAIPFLSVGLHTIAARATDLAGNATTVATSVNVRENGGDDTEPPTVTVLQPLDGATIGAGLFTVRGTASDNVAVESVFVGINLSGQQLATGTTNWQIVLDGSLLEQGAQTILVSAIDSSGNRSALQSFSINIDRDIPQALVEGAVAPISTRDSATFFVSGENVASYAYTLDDGPMSGAIPAGTPLELLDLDDGFHVLEVIGLDPIGVSQVTPTEFSWLVSTTPDEASIDPLPELPIATDALTVTLLDADGFRYRVDGGDWSDRISAPSRSAQVQLSGLTDGAHRIEVLGSDGLGNEQSDPEIAVWAVDRTPPPAPLLIEFPPSRVPGNSVSLRVGGPDVEAFNYRLNGG
ncbi:MAG: Ig-like domain-containing protein, partial [Myxococcota bacterium]